MSEQPLNEARALMAAYRHDEAEQLLDEVIGDGTQGSPDLWAELGIVYCHTQREAQAAGLLSRARGGESFSRLGQILADHFECRRRMARKLRVRDETGASLLKAALKATEHRPAGVGVKLSACLIVKNEERHLDRCLQSLTGIADEIVVVDTGSTDSTLEIAARHGAVIGHFEWSDDFSAARNESLGLATGDWILWIDADEELTQESLTGIREGLMRPHFGGYYIRILNLMDDEGEANQYVHSPLRLFRNMPGIEFTGTVHEQISPSLAKHGLPFATIESALIRHYGYRPCEMESKGKIERTLQMLETQLKAEPDVAFHWFNLANAHTVASNFEGAVEAAIECIERLDEGNTFASLTYQLLQTALIELGKPEQAIQKADEAAAKGFAGILTEFERAHALSRLGRLEEALACIDKCFELDWPRDLTGDYGIVTHKRHLLKAQILAQMGRLDEAHPLLDHVLCVDPSSAAAHHTKGAVLEKQAQFGDALRHYEQAFASPAQGRAARKGATRIHLVTGSPMIAASLAKELWLEQRSDEDAWNLWVAACESRGDFEGAAEAYEQRLLSEGYSADLLLNFGRLLQRAGEPQSAMNCYLEAAKLAPYDPNILFNVGDLLYSAESFEAAAEAYQGALRLKPDYAQGWFVLGNCFARIGSDEGAVLGYKQALALDPAHKQASHNLAELLQSNAA